MGEQVEKGEQGEKGELEVENPFSEDPEAGIVAGTDIKP